MAIRNIRTDGDEILRKSSRKVDVINDRILTLLDDMAETMYYSKGVGLAAPQIGVLRRVVVIDVGDGLVELVNPEIIKKEGEQKEIEGCLSIPGVIGEVIRPERVVISALNRDGQEITIEAEELLARAFCHEIDHLDGILFKDKVVRFLDEEEIRRGAEQLEEDAEQLKEDVEQFEEDVEQFEEDVEQFEEDAEQLEEDAEQLEEDAEQLKEDVEQLKEDVEQFEEDAEQLEEDAE